MKSHYYLVLRLFEYHTSMPSWRSQFIAVQRTQTGKGPCKVCPRGQFQNHYKNIVRIVIHSVPFNFALSKVGSQGILYLGKTICKSLRELIFMTSTISDFVNKITLQIEV